MHKKIVQWMLLACGLLSVACKTPYSQALSIDWNGQPAPGTMTVSQPKMYQRASLINERNAKTRWLNELLSDAALKNLKFTPQIAREMEQITTFAMALGLNFDPATAISSRRAKETGDLQQQIDVLTLQMKLDQLKRDAAAAAASSSPSRNDGDGAATGTAGAAAATNEKPASATPADRELQTAIKTLTDTLHAYIASDVKQTSAPMGTDPSDIFRDMSAYRELIEAARNATGLDDLHDLDGRALIRLNFQAMVIPDREHASVPGVIEMKIAPPNGDKRDQEKLYKGWLEHINQQLNAVAPSGKESSDTFLQSAVADNFDLAVYRYLPAGEVPRGVNVPHTACSGIALDSSAPAAAANGCRSLRFAVPKFKGTSVQEGAYSTFSAYKNAFNLTTSEEEDRNDDLEGRNLIRLHAKSVVQNCGLPAKPHVRISPEVILYDHVRKAQMRAAAGDVLIGIERSAARILFARDIAIAPPDEEQQKIVTRSARARLFLATFVMAAYARCTPEQIQDFDDASPVRYVPPGFLAAMDKTQAAMVYEIGPREQAQQVSSVSRIANNLSLAGALAATAPRTGAGLDAAANYSRQVIGKASTIERVPSVIGYAVDKGVFGWVIGPAAVFDPQGSVRLEQISKAIDLTVDLSLPGWWPWFNVEVTNVWAPKPASIIAGSIKLPGQKPTVMKVLTSPNYADYDALTARLMLGGRLEDRQVFLSDRTLAGQSLTACKESTLYLRGNNIWRATSALVGDQLLDETNITVAPDMSGVLLKIPPLDQRIAEAKDPMLPISVFTRYGPADGKVTYFSLPGGGNCKPAQNSKEVAKP